VLAGLAIAGACAGHAARAPLRQADGTRLITLDMIQQAHASNAWDLLVEMGTGYRIADTQLGDAKSIRNSRGKSSILLREADTPLLVLDGVRMTDPLYLRNIPTSTLLSIRMLNGIDGATYYGTNAGAGVIIVSTRLGEVTEP
jgi:hypothetical protein